MEVACRGHLCQGGIQKGKMQFNKYTHTHTHTGTEAEAGYGDRDGNGEGEQGERGAR